MAKGSAGLRVRAGDSQSVSSWPQSHWEDGDCCGQAGGSQQDLQAGGEPDLGACGSTWSTARPTAACHLPSHQNTQAAAESIPEKQEKVFKRRACLKVAVLMAVNLGDRTHLGRGCGIPAHRGWKVPWSFNLRVPQSPCGCCDGRVWLHGLDGAKTLFLRRVPVSPAASLELGFENQGLGDDPHLPLLPLKQGP